MKCYHIDYWDLSLRTWRILLPAITAPESEIQPQFLIMSRTAALELKSTAHDWSTFTSLSFWLYSALQEGVPGWLSFERASPQSGKRLNFSINPRNISMRSFSISEAQLAAYTCKLVNCTDSLEVRWWDVILWEQLHSNPGWFFFPLRFQFFISLDSELSIVLQAQDGNFVSPVPTARLGWQFYTLNLRNFNKEGLPKVRWCTT